MDKKAIKKLTELDEDLSSFNGVGDETDVKEVMHQIETVMSNAKTSEGKARFADFEGASQGSELAKLQDYNEDKKEAMIEKVKDFKESTIKALNKTSSIDVVNKAYQEFKDGDIEYDQYIAILDSVKNTSENMSEEKIKENTTDSFIAYLEDRGMLEDYLNEHATFAEQEKINNLDKETKGYVDRIEEAYKNDELNNADYEELRSSALNEGATATEKLLEEKLKDDDQSNSSAEGIIRVLNGGTAVAKKVLEDYIKEKGPEFIASNVNKWLAENTFHFVNLGGVAKFAGGGENLVSILPSISSDFIRTGAAHGVPIVGSIIDFGFQVADGEDTTDAAIKTGGHTGAAVGTAIGGPIGTVAGAAIGFGGGWLFDKIYDNKEEIFEGAKNLVGDAVSGIADGLVSVFS